MQNNCGLEDGNQKCLFFAWYQTVSFVEVVTGGGCKLVNKRDGKEGHGKVARLDRALKAGFSLFSSSHFKNH